MNILRRHCHFANSRNTFVNGTFYSSSNSTIQYFPTKCKSKLFYLRPFAFVQRDILHVGHSDEFHWSVVKYFKTAPRSLDERMAPTVRLNFPRVVETRVVRAIREFNFSTTAREDGMDDGAN